ncbi:MAG TPA: 5'-3' exonuclease H3TH domain-containing protein [Euzebyales bacterium]|nr:5'-3' exonuclease H3TH domain-containing protein [Euzebyales bacterium]
MTESLALFDADLVPASQAIAEPISARRARPAGAGAVAKRTLLAVDGNSLVHRAFHAYGGTVGGARYGFFALLSVVCDQVAYDGLVVGFDCRARSERRARFAAYKAQRPDKHEQLDASLDELPEIASAMGVHVVVAGGWEADDVLASAATLAEAQGWGCVVASPDRDVLALVSPDTMVLQIRGGDQPIRRVTAADFRRRHRITPAQYLQLAALRGDSSDNLPGITGIGAKKAAALLRTYATVEEAVADPLGCRSVLGPELGQALIDDLAAPTSVYRRNVELMTLRRDVAIDLDLCRRRVEPEQILEVLRRWRMTGLHARMCAALAVRPDAGDVPAVGDEDAPPPGV